jgi:hypothetical protein
MKITNLPITSILKIGTLDNTRELEKRYIAGYDEMPYGITIVVNACKPNLYSYIALDLRKHSDSLNETCICERFLNSNCIQHDFEIPDKLEACVPGDLARLKRLVQAWAIPCCDDARKYFAQTDWQLPIRYCQFCSSELNIDNE